MILGVAIDTPLRRLFDYRPPDGVRSEAIQPGLRVWVPFGRRRVVGLIVERRSTSTVPAAKLRSALELIDAEPAVDRVLFELLRWSADYYRHPIGEVFATAWPAAVRKGVPLVPDETTWQLTEHGRQHALAELSTRAHKLRAVIELLHTAGPSSAEAILEATGSGSAILRKLAERGYLSRHSAPIAPPQAVPAAIRPGPELSDAQRVAVGALRGALGSFSCCLLHGVTGSGKTEVYLHAIDAALARGEQALVLVPEIALTPQLIARFRERCDAPTAILHSGLSDGDRLAAWRSARSGAARIVIGTRSAVFAPLSRPGIIIVDEEHDTSYKQQDGFRYSARDLAIARAQRHGIPVVLGSATPALETLARAQRQQGTMLVLPQRAAAAQPPRLSLVDLRRHADTQGIATPVLQSMQRHLEAGNQVLLFLNRRGYAPVLFCPSCGWSAHCRRCDAHLTVHRGSRDLVCHHCAAQQSLPERCPTCSAPTKPVGQGTERIEETIARLFPQFPLARIDRDSMRRRGELEATLERIARSEVRILVGTQMLTKGHHFPDVTLVVVLNADQGLFSTDFRASERLAQTIVQVAGRAGRAERAGEVLIQTEYAQHPLLGMLLAGGYEAFAGAALEERRQSGWPPFSRIALVRAEAAAPAAAMQFLERALCAARERPVGGVELLGPAPAPMERRAGRYRAQLLLRAPTHSPLQRLLGALLPVLESLPEAKRVRWSIDVDPQEMF